MKYLSLIFFIVFSAYCSAQKKVIVKDLSKNDSITYQNLKQQFAKYINPAPDSSLVYAAKIKEFSLDRNYSIGIVEAPYFKANYFRRMQQLDSAIFYFDTASKLAKKYNYQRGIALSQNGL